MLEDVGEREEVPDGFGGVVDSIPSLGMFEEDVGGILDVGRCVREVEDVRDAAYFS